MHTLLLELWKEKLSSGVFRKDLLAEGAFKEFPERSRDFSGEERSAKICLHLYK